MNKELYTAGHVYLKKGFSILPLVGKKPMLPKWKEFQNRKATNQELIEWCMSPEITGIGIITGHISNIVVLDTEKEADLSSKEIPKTVTVKSGDNGKHFYFKYPKDIQIKSLTHTAFDANFIADLQSDGKYIVAPPSIHPNKNKYEWIIDLDEEMAEMPKWLVDLQHQLTGRENKSRDWSKMFEGVKEGARHSEMVKKVGKLTRVLPEHAWKDFLFPIVQLLNGKNVPPLPSEEVQEIVSYCINKNTTKTKDEVISLFSADEVMEALIEEELFIVDKLVPSKGIIALSGHPGCGKSWIMLEIAKSVALGEKLFGEYTTDKASVLIVDEEEGLAELQKRLKKLDWQKNMDIHFFTQKNLKIDEKKDLDLLITEIQKKDIGLVIIDPLIAVHSKNENSADDMQKVMDSLAQLNKVGAAVMYIHHHRKDGIMKSNAGQSLRGSSAFSGRADSHIAVEKESEDGDIIKMTISQEKTRRGKKNPPFTIILEEKDGKISLQHKEGTDKEKYKKDRAKEVIVEFLSSVDGASVEEVIKALGIDYGAKNIRLALNEMTESEEILKTKIGKKHVFHVVIDENNSDQEEKEIMRHITREELMNL